MSIVLNERWKLTATYLNGMAITVFAVGSFAPMIAFVSATSQVTVEKTATISLGCLGVSLVPHLLGRYVLRRLVP